MTALFPTRFDLQGSTSRQSSKKRLGKNVKMAITSLLHRHYTLQLPFANLETDFEMPGRLANQEVAPKRPSLRIWFWQESLLAMASSCGSFQDLWFVAILGIEIHRNSAQHLNANILSQDGCSEPEHNFFGSLSFFWSLGRWIRRGAAEIFRFEDSRINIIRIVTFVGFPLSGVLSSDPQKMMSCLEPGRWPYSKTT